MHHFAAANTRPVRARRTQPAQRYDFVDSDSEEEEDDEAPPQRGGSRLRSAGDRGGLGAAATAEAAAPRDAASVVNDIKQAVSLSLKQSSTRERELMDEVTKERERGGRRWRKAFIFPIDWFRFFFSHTLFFKK